MTDFQAKRRVKKVFPSSRESEYGPIFSPVGSTSLRSHTAARWFRAFRTIDSSPLRQSSARCSPLPIRSRLLKSIGVHIHLSAKQLDSSHYATPNKGRKRESPQKIVRNRPMNRLSLVEEPKIELLARYLKPVRAKPKKHRGNRQSQEALSPWEPGCLEISPMANSRPEL